MNKSNTAASKQYIERVRRLANATNDDGVKTNDIKKDDALHFELNEGNRTALIKSVLPMVINMAKGRVYGYSYRIEIDDLIQCGNLAAVIAADNFLNTPVETRLKKNAKFSTYAYNWIFKYMIEHCEKFDSILSHSRTTYKDLRGTTETISGDDMYGNEGEGDSRFESPEVSKITAVKQAEKDLKMLRLQSKKLFSELSERDRNILFMLYGIGNDKSMTYAQISEKMGLSIGGVHRIVASALNRLIAVGKDPELVGYWAYLEGVDISNFKEWQIDITFDNDSTHREKLNK